MGQTPYSQNFDVIVVGAGLAGLVAATEAIATGSRVLLIDQESSANLGAQAHWSFGGIFLVDSPEQRRLGVKDSEDLAMRDWFSTAGFDREEDYWPRAWARAYVHWAANGKRDWLRERGIRFFPVVGVGRARWGRCPRALELGAALSYHLGYRTGPCRTLRQGRHHGRGQGNAQHLVEAPVR